jgi:hypothetical protein
LLLFISLLVEGLGVYAFAGADFLIYGLDFAGSGCELIALGFFVAVFVVLAEDLNPA